MSCVMFRKVRSGVMLPLAFAIAEAFACTIEEVFCNGPALPAGPPAVAGTW